VGQTAVNIATTGQVAQSGSVLEAHSTAVTMASFDPNGAAVDTAGLGALTPTARRPYQ